MYEFDVNDLKEVGDKLILVMDFKFFEVLCVNYEVEVVSWRYKDLLESLSNEKE